MTDRLNEIRARLATVPHPEKWSDPGEEWIGSMDFLSHAPADIAWLLDALADEQRHSEMLIDRIDQLHVEITNLRFGKPERDVAYDVTMHRGSVGGYTGPQSDGPPAPALPPVGVEVVNPFTGERIVREADDA